MRPSATACCSRARPGRCSAFAVLVYLLPLVLFFVGYGVGAGMKLGGGLSALIGGVLFVVGILSAMWYSHKLKLRNEAPFAITERL